MYRKIGFVLLLTALVMAVLMQQKRLLFVPHTPPKVTSVVEYTKPDGTIVHATAVEAHQAEIRWIFVVPIAVFFLAGAMLVSFTKSK